MRYLGLSTLSPDSRPVSVIGLGTWQFGSREWGYGAGYADSEARVIVRRAVELGITLFDTAEVYGFGRSERILGAGLDDRRGDAFLATKLMPVAPVPGVVEQRGMASARRLGVRAIDLYQVHQPNPVVPDTVTMSGMRRLLDLGLVRAVGVSNYSLARWESAERALGSPVVSNQVPFSLVARRPLADLVPYVAGRERMLIACSPLGQGLLCGRYDPTTRPTNGVRRLNSLFTEENLRRAAGLLATVREVGAALDLAPAQVALAWVVSFPHVVAIPGAASVAQLESNAVAADVVLAADERDALTQAAHRFSPVRGVAAWRDLLRR
ncbi:MAG: aldo/keto reductase [Actinomycetes bacterium]